MPTPLNQRVRRRREALRAAGMRPVQIWVPDTRRAEAPKKWKHGCAMPSHCICVGCRRTGHLFRYR